MEGGVLLAYEIPSCCFAHVFDDDLADAGVAVLGAIVDTIPLILNGAIGAHYHIPFPVVTRSSFGYYFSRFAVIVRLITALFWNGQYHATIFEKYELSLILAIQTWTGSQAMYQVRPPSPSSCSRWNDQ